MTDKRSDSARPSARPPLPSLAPPTDDIDSEWGADEIPAAARAPQVAAAAPSPSKPPSASPESYPSAPEPPTPRPSSPAAAPRPSSPAAARPSAPAPAATASAAPVASNPLRKQTLFGIAPIVAPRSEPTAAVASNSEPPRPSAARSEPPRASQPVSSPPAASNPWRKQTLLGMAPVVVPRSEPPAAQPSASAPDTAAAEAAPAPKPDAPKPEAATEPAASAALEAANAAAADAVESDAPITRDVTSKSSPAPRVASSASHSDSDDLPELRPRRPRWILPVAAAAAIGLGVLGLRQLDREPTANPVAAAPKPEAKATQPPQRAEGDETDSDPDPTTPTESEPLQAKAEAAPAAPAKAASHKPVTKKPAATDKSSTAESGEALDAAEAAQTTTTDLKSVNVDSEPQGARMFWRGKEVGTTPFVLEIPSGARRSYELGRPGFVTRKVVIDGSKSEITIGLKPDSDTPTGTNP